MTFEVFDRRVGRPAHRVRRLGRVQRRLIVGLADGPRRVADLSPGSGAVSAAHLLAGRGLIELTRQAPFGALEARLTDAGRKVADTLAGRG